MFFKNKKEPSGTKKPETGDFSFPNPEPCLERLKSILEIGKSKGAVLKIYLEDFKAFNDTFGIRFGGLFIERIGRFLSDLPGAEAYRINGVEFIVILDRADRYLVRQIVSAIVDRFENSWHINNLDCVIAMNLGYEYYPGGAETASEMMEDLANAVNASAAAGQNRAIIFDDDIRKRVFRKHRIAMDIPQALNEGRVELRYRPSYNVGLKRFTRADCYIRLFSPDFGMIQANEFIPIAEESGQICAVGQYTLTKVCRLIASLLEQKKDFETIAVPISSIQFLQEHFVDDVAAIIKEAGIPPEKLAIETAESILINSYAIAQVRLGELAQMGIEIVLTDYGTGSAGIGSVLSMPISAVKLERMLIWQLENDPRAAYLVGGLVYIAKNLGLKMIAQGVETENQVALLAKFGCEYSQGFYYSPTRTPAELMKVFHDHA